MHIDDYKFVRIIEKSIEPFYFSLYTRENKSYGVYCFECKNE